MVQPKKMILYIILLCTSSALAAEMSIDTDAPYCYGRPFNITCHCSQNSTGQPQLFDGNDPINVNLTTLNSTTTVYTVFPSLESYALSCGGCPDDSKSGTFTFSPSICLGIRFPVISSSAITCSVDFTYGPQQNFTITISTMSMGIQNVTGLITGGERKNIILKKLQPNSAYTISVEIHHTSPQLHYDSNFSVTTTERILVLKKIRDEESVELECQFMTSPMFHPGNILWFLNGINVSKSPLCNDISPKTCSRSMTMDRKSITGTVACAVYNNLQDTFERSNEVYVHDDIPRPLWPIAFSILLVLASIIVTVVVVRYYWKKRTKKG